MRTDELIKFKYTRRVHHLSIFHKEIETPGIFPLWNNVSYMNLSFSKEFINSPLCKFRTQFIHASRSNPQGKLLCLLEKNNRCTVTDSQTKVNLWKPEVRSGVRNEEENANKKDLCTTERWLCLVPFYLKLNK